MIQLYQTLDLRPIGIPQTLRLSQYDSDFEIIFKLENFDGTWILDTGTTAEIQGTKTDGHGYSADATFNASTKEVTIAGDVQMTAAAGRNVFEVVLFHDGDRLGSKNFILDVERAALDAETTASDSKIKNFTAMTEAAEAAAETATAAAEAAEDAAASVASISDEVAGIRTGEDGTVYASAGDAVRGQAEDVYKAFDVINGADGLTPLYKPLVIGSSGKWTSATSYHICIPVKAGDTVELKGSALAVYYGILQNASAVQTAAAAFSTASGFTTRILLSANGTAEITVPADGKYLYSGAVDTQGREQLPASIKINGIEQTYNIRAKIETLCATAKAQWLSNVMASQASTKTIHFSCDDVTFLSALLASPAPASIWDVPEFEALQTIHENSGACITLMLFNELDSYDISLIPATWAAEFQAAKSWLKFALHAKTSGTKYDTDTTGASDYTKFVNAVYSFTGDYGCIDRVPRLGYYAGTIDQLQAMAALDYGPVGFLTADDARQSYYLGADQTAFVNAHGRFYDVDNMFVFVPTIARLDTGATAQTGIDAIQACGAKADMYIEIFCHATGTSSGIITRMQRFQDIAIWAAAHGYVNGFLTDYFA